jgi:hypothetical protein
MRTASVLSAVVLLGGVAVSALPAAPPVVPEVQLDRRINLNITDLLEKGKDLLDEVKLPDNIDVPVPDGDEIGDMWDKFLGLFGGGKSSSR